MTAQPQKKFLKDYQAPAFLARKTKLHFDLQDEFSLVTSQVSYERNHADATEMRLDGNGLELLELYIDDKKLDLGSIDFSPEHLSLKDLPKNFDLKVVTKLYPQKNTALEGLYRSGSKYCTQCEPEGFRRITYYCDRPDNMSEFENDHPSG